MFVSFGLHIIMIFLFYRFRVQKNKQSHVKLMDNNFFDCERLNQLNMKFSDSAGLHNKLSVSMFQNLKKHILIY